MKGERLREGLFLLIKCGLIGLLLCALLIPAVLQWGWPPVIGNLLAARSIEQYAAQIYPDWEADSHWAGYNLVDNGYYLAFHKGEEQLSLRIDWPDQTISDDGRAWALEERLAMDEAVKDFHLWKCYPYQHIFWAARWSVEEPEQTRITVRVDLSDAADDPVLNEAAMREKMATRAMEVYDTLSPLTTITCFSVHYAHWGVESQNDGVIWNRITIELPQGEPLTREAILSGELQTK